MIDLTPRQAASLSNEVYALTKFPILEDAITHLNHEYGGNLSFYEENMLKGKTGGPGIIKVSTAFGFLLVGQKNLKGQAFILFRGTQYLADWLTNLNLTLSPSASGQPVHDGFNKAFHSMLPQISVFVRSLPGELESTVWGIASVVLWRQSPLNGCESIRYIDQDCIHLAAHGLD